MKDKDYSFTLKFDVAKPPVWHCDDGVLKMGVIDPPERTYYWSYTNIALSGNLILGNKDFEVAGKAWFDK